MLVGEPSPKDHVKIVVLETSVLELVNSNALGAQAVVTPPIGI